MKPLSDLTYQEKLHRFRLLASVALDAYGLKKPRFKLTRYAGNVVFRAYAPNQTHISTPNEAYEAGQYLLRIHDPIEQASDAIALEMNWLNAICNDTLLAVPKPIRNFRGDFVTRCSISDIPELRDCTLLHWLKGRRIIKSIRPCHFQAQGEAMAQLHNHAEKWESPYNLAKRRFDYDGLFMDNAGAGITNGAVWPLLPKCYLQPYEIVAKHVKQITSDWGKSPDVYGLIHGDCGVDANVLFWRGNAHIIDFDGSGFGYYMYDMALALEHCWEDKLYPQYRDALLRGYARFRALPDAQLRNLGLFTAAFYVYMGLWTAAMDQTYPNSPRKHDRHEKWLRYGLKFIKRYLAS